jgi:uncharacterized protein (DUF1778 family)
LAKTPCAILVLPDTRPHGLEPHDTISLPPSQFCPLGIDLYGSSPYYRYQEDNTMTVANTTARLEARISTDLHAMLKRAAELQGRTMTDFVVSAVQDAAQRAIEQAEIVRLSLADQECFAQALLSPPKPTPALERAFARRSKLLRAE